MEPRGKDNLDRWLDRALQEYGQAPTVPGLEGRILEQLSRRRTLFWPQLWLALAAIGAVAGVLTVLWVGHASYTSHKNSTTIMASHSEQLPAPGKDNEVRPRPEAIRVTGPAKQANIRRIQIPQTRTPKLDQFPAPRPLSPQEQMLQHYVQAFPDDAASAAREQAQLETEIEAWFAESARANRSQEEK